MRVSSRLFVGVVAGLLMLGGGSAHAQEETPDPLEPINRGIFEFNRVVDGLFIRPASIIYGNVVPELGRQGIRNFLDNLRAPVTFANDVLQGETDRAGVTLGRFMINTIFGFGLFDVASQVSGFPKHYEDFGQTMAVWGVGSGPYLVLPLLGPSTLRDAGGMVVDSVAFDPLGFFYPLAAEIPLQARIARVVVDGVDLRYRVGPALDDLYESSLDPYATFRTVWLQRRAAEIRNGAPATEDYDSIFDEEGE